MLKRYYSLDDAMAYLSEKSGIKVTALDLFDHIQAKRIRLSAWFSGYLAQVKDDEFGFETDSLILKFHRFNGYLSCPSPCGGVSPDFIEGTNPFEEYTVSRATVIESSSHNLPILPEGESFFIWKGYAVRKYLGLTLIEAGDQDHPEGFFTERICLNTHRNKVLIPATDLDALLAGKPRANAKPVADAEPAEVETARNWPLIAGALLDLLTRDGRTNQSGIIVEMADRKIRGLGKRTLEGAFPEATRAYSERRKE